MSATTLADARHVITDRKPPPEVRRRRFLLAVANHSVALLLSLMFIIPLFVVMTTAFMTHAQVGTGKVIPDPFYFGNFQKVFTQIPFLRYLANTVIYAGLATVGVVLSSIPVAYAFSRLRWRGRDATFILVLATMMLPAQVTSVSLYIVFTRLHLVGTLAPLILPTFFGDAFSIFLLRQFFMTLPKELEDAAKIDGCGPLGIYWNVCIPLSKPALATVAVFSFMAHWNDFMGPLIYIQSMENKTLALGLASFKSLHGTEYHLMMAASIAVLMPVLMIFFSAQKYFVKGIVMSGIKG